MLKRKIILFTLTILFLLVIVSCNNDNKPIHLENPNLSVENSALLTRYLDSLTNFTETNDDSLKQFSDKILISFPNNKEDVSEKIAHIFYTKSKFHLTKYYFGLAASGYFKNGSMEQYAEQLANIGVLNELMGEYPTAIDNYFEALEIFEGLNLELKSSFVYNNLGIVYQQIKDKENALNYYKKSLRITDKIERYDLSASRLNNIASVFEEFDNDLDSALFYYKKSFDICNNDSLLTTIVIVEANIANIYIQKNNLTKADSILDHALNNCIENNLTTNLTTIYTFKAELYLKQDNFVASELYAKKAIKLSNEQSYKKSELTGMKVLIDCYQQMGDYTKSYHQLVAYNELKEEIVGTNQQNEINQLTIKHQIKEKDNQIAILELQNKLSTKRNKILVFVVVLIILFLIVLFYVFSLQKKHVKLKIKSMQRDIVDYIKQVTAFENEIHEIELSQHELFLQKVKQFNLTDREEEVLFYISNGFKNTEIAEKMFVSINTIKSHIKNLFVKLEVRNRIEATNKTKVN